MTTHIFSKGSGTPLVLIPGIQGRWEYMHQTVDALAEWFRVITFALSGERASSLPFDPERGLDNYVAQVLQVLDENQIDRAIICGVSFGGFAALRFAAAHPHRTAALILASTPAPMFQLKRRHRLYARAPHVFGPLFVVESPWRIRRELAAAFPTFRERLRFQAAQLKTFLRAPISLSRMGERGRIMSAVDLTDECRRVTAPTLIVTGEARLDHVVPVSGSSDYLQRIADARHVVMEHTGHLGVMTRPDAFAAIVREFMDKHRHAAA